MSIIPAFGSHYRPLARLAQVQEPGGGGPPQAEEDWGKERWR
jgi:hypothetical protein